MGPPARASELTREQRSTRGKRYKAALADEEAEADNQFWAQDFFAEDAVDDDYQEEKVSEDVPDSDFEESEEEDDGGPGSDVEEKPRKKTLKPPGAPSTARPRAPKAPKAPKPEPDEDYEEEEAEGEDGPPTKRRQVRDSSPAPAPAPPSLRRSTIVKSNEARSGRQVKAEERKPRKRQNKDDNWRPMTQQELLAEAARTEMENMASLKLLLAMEEETKRRAATVKKQFQGPSVRFHSLRSNDTEHTSLTVCNMHYPPPWLRRMRAPQPPHQPRCLITGLPALYRDPASGQPFATAAAFKHLGQQQQGAGAGAPGLETAGGLPVGGGAVRTPRGKRGERTQQALMELAQAPEVQVPAPQGPYELPLELMALVVDLRAKLQGGA